MYIKKNPNQLFKDPLWQQLDIFMSIFFLQYAQMQIQYAFNTYLLPNIYYIGSMVILKLIITF